jgi:hypothetical protein
VKTTTATYVSKNGTQYEMELSQAKQIVGDGKDSDFVEVKINPTGQEQIGNLFAGGSSGVWYTIYGVEVNDGYRRQGLATAMLEFARRESPLPILHSPDLSPEGEAFAQTTKYSANQPRDERGRFGSTGASSVSHIDRLQGSQVANAGFKKSITEDESKALVKYKENDFSPINMMLRNGGIAPELPSMQKNVDNLDALIDKAPPVGETFTTHRVVLGRTASQLEGLQSGWSFKDPAFMSTTLDKSHAESRIRIANDEERISVRMNIIVQKGQKGLFVEPLIKGKSKISILHEEEFLLPRNTVLTKIGNNADGSIDMVAELD